VENYPKIEEPVVPDLENSRFLSVAFYCIHGDKFGGEQNMTSSPWIRLKQ